MMPLDKLVGIVAGLNTQQRRKPNPAAVALGKIKSKRKAAAARENGKKGGRPRREP